MSPGSYEAESIRRTIHFADRKTLYSSRSHFFDPSEEFRQEIINKKIMIGVGIIAVFIILLNGLYIRLVVSICIFVFVLNS